MMPERVIRVEEVAGSWRYTVPLLIPLYSSRSIGSIIILNHQGWNDLLLREENELVYNMVQSINAMNGVRVIDLRHLKDGTSCLNILTPSIPGDVHTRITSILREFFTLQDCSIEGLPSV